MPGTIRPKPKPKPNPKSSRTPSSSYTEVFRHRMKVCEYTAEYGEHERFNLYGKRFLENVLRVPLKQTHPISDTKASPYDFLNPISQEQRYLYTMCLNCGVMPFEARDYERDPQRGVDALS